MRTLFRTISQVIFIQFTGHFPELPYNQLQQEGIPRLSSWGIDRRIWLQQCGSDLYHARVMQEYLDQVFIWKHGGRGCRQEWLPCSPGINILDFHVGHLKQKIYSKPPQLTGQLKMAIVKGSSKTAHSTMTRLKEVRLKRVPLCKPIRDNIFIT